MSCDNPDCIACAFQAAHPEEKRTHLVLATTHLLKLVVGTMAETSLHLDKMERRIREAGIDPEQHTAFFQAKYNELVDRLLCRKIAHTDYEITGGLKVLFALLPADVLAAAWECYEMHIAHWAKELEKEDEVPDSLADAHKFFDDFVRTGRLYLEGVPPDFPPTTAPHSTTLQ